MSPRKKTTTDAKAKRPSRRKTPRVSNDRARIEAAIAEARPGRRPPRERLSIERQRSIYSDIAAHCKRCGVVHPLFTDTTKGGD